MHVKEIIDGIDSVFDGSDTGIYEMLQSKHEIEGEWRADEASYGDSYNPGGYYPE